MTASRGAGAEPDVGGLALPVDRGWIAARRADFDASGVLVFGPPFIAPGTFDALREEARRQRSAAWRCARAGGEGEPCAQHNLRSELGPVARGLLGAGPVIDALEGMTGMRLAPSFEASCFTYYESPDDFLGIHTDRRTSCRVTLLVYLDARHGELRPSSPGVELHVYSSWAGAAGPPQLRVTARANRAVVLLGSALPHGRPRLGEGESITLLSACFEAVGARRAPAHVEEDDTTPGALVHGGFTRWQAGDFARAHALFARAVALAPEDPAAWSGLGHALWSLRRFDEARRCFLAACERDPGCAAHWSNLGLALRDLGERASAVESFAAAISCDAGYAPAYNEWANVLLDDGRPWEALPLYQRALELDGSRAVVHHNLGVCYLALGAREEALACFLAALRRDPAYHHALEEVGILVAEAGDAAAAAGWLRRAGTERARQILASLGQPGEGGADPGSGATEAC